MDTSNIKCLKQLITVQVNVWKASSQSGAIFGKITIITQNTIKMHSWGVANLYVCKINFQWCKTISIFWIKWIGWKWVYTYPVIASALWMWSTRKYWNLEVSSSCCHFYLRSPNPLNLHFANMTLHTAFPNQRLKHVCIEKDKVWQTMPKLQVMALIMIYDVGQGVEEAVPISQHHFALATMWSQEVIWIIRTSCTGFHSKLFLWGVKNSGKYNTLKVTGYVLCPNILFYTNLIFCRSYIYSEIPALLEEEFASSKRHQDKPSTL